MKISGEINISESQLYNIHYDICGRRSVKYNNGRGNIGIIRDILDDCKTRYLNDSRRDEFKYIIPSEHKAIVTINDDIQLYYPERTILFISRCVGSSPYAIRTIDSECSMCFQKITLESSNTHELINVQL